MPTVSLQEQLYDKTRSTSSHLEATLRKLAKPTDPLDFPRACTEIISIADKLRYDVTLLVERWKG